MEEVGVVGTYVLLTVEARWAAGGGSCLLFFRSGDGDPSTTSTSTTSGRFNRSCSFHIMPDKGIAPSGMELFFWILSVHYYSYYDWGGWMGGRTYKRWLMGLSLARMIGILEGKGIVFWVSVGTT